jgi:hypothetical protein
MNIVVELSPAQVVTAPSLPESFIVDILTPPCKAPTALACALPGV